MRAQHQESTKAEYFVASIWFWLPVLVLVTRLPYFFVGVIDWDESTFMLMGRAILDGYLPYQYVWDNKPPLLFAVFAGLGALPGDPVLVVRVFGALCVIATAILVYLIACRIWNPRAAAVAAALYVLGMAVEGSGQATTSELISMVPVLVAVWLLIAAPPNVAAYAAVGALLSIATLVRLNLGIVVVAVAMWITLAEYRGGLRKLVPALTSYGVAGLAVLAACAIPYAFDGTLDLFWYSVFGAPFEYASTQNGPVENLVRQAQNAIDLRIAQLGRFAFGWIGWTASIAGLVLVARRYARERGAFRSAILIVLLTGLGTGLSILVSGAAWLHYLIALLPFVAIFGGIAYAALGERVSYAAVAVILAVGAASILLETSREYTSLQRRAAQGGGLMHGASYDIARYLRPRCDQECSVYLMEGHLAYVLLSAYPPRKIVTHPSNIAKPSLLSPRIGTEATPALEMRTLLSLRPEYIVKRETVSYLQPDQAVLVDEVLAHDYELVRELGDLRIYRAKPEATTAVDTGARRP